MGNFLTDAFNTIANWFIQVAEWPGTIPTLAVGLVVGATAFVLKGQNQ